MGGATVLWDGPLHPAHLVRGGAVTIIRIDPRNTLAGVRRVVRHLRPYRGRLAPPRSC
jgi:hypothetical protein